MLTYTQAIVLGALQGLTELFPISSLGHSVILPSLLHWHIDQSADYFLPFLVLTHLATAIVLLAFFWKDWLRIIGGIFRSLAQREVRTDDVYAKLGWLLIVGTIPAGLLGVLFEKKFKLLFADPKLVAGFLFFNGIALFFAELLRRKRARISSMDSDATIAKLTWKQDIGIGLMQSLALLPGLSRTGMALSGGLLSGFAHEEAARFAFLLATPIITAAALLEVPSLFAPGTSSMLAPAIVGAFASAIAAYLSVRFLTRYFKTNTLTPFAAYCCAAGIIAFFLL